MTESTILVIYTGGTIGMSPNDEGALSPDVLSPEIKTFLSESVPNYRIHFAQTKELLDSSDIDAHDWLEIYELIRAQSCNGVIVLHGTDTMSFSATAMSYLLQLDDCPVVFTGAQIPSHKEGSDAWNNLSGAMDALKELIQNKTINSFIYFGEELLLANRSTKKSSHALHAFHCPNSSMIVGKTINSRYELKASTGSVASVKLFPGIDLKQSIKSHIDSGAKTIVLETYGTGNVPSKDGLAEYLKECIGKGIVFVNLSQCANGSVDMSQYETGRQLLDAGVINGGDSTFEAVITKLLLFGHLDQAELSQLITQSLAGELTVAK